MKIWQKKEINAIVKNVTKTTDEWASATEIPAKGVICVETTTDGDTKIKIGDGTNAFSGLKYIDGDTTDIAKYIGTWGSPTQYYGKSLKMRALYNKFDDARFGLTTDTDNEIRVDYATNAATLEGFHANEIASNPNLLINPDFKINQQGKTEYDITTGYIVDKWQLDARTQATIEEDDIKIKCAVDSSDDWWSLFQPLTVTGDTVTMSIYVSEILVSSSEGFFYLVGKTTSKKLQLGLNTFTISKEEYPMRYNVNGFGIAMKGVAIGDFIKISWAKLELGSLATPFVPPNPALELLKIQAIDGTIPAATVNGHTVNADVPAGAKFITAGTGTNAEVFNGLTSSSASGRYSHAEGTNTTAMGHQSHAEGTAFSQCPSTITLDTKRSEILSIWKATWATGEEFSLASGTAAHVENMACIALGNASHAEGGMTAVLGQAGHTEGWYTIADSFQHAQGHFNKIPSAGEPSTTVGDAFIIGNGSSDTSRSNAFRVAYNGTVYATNATISTGADYAEYFEWADGNPNNEDRVGHFVTFDENDTKKIRLATSTDDYILGIVSGMPSVIGNGDEDWKQRFVLDDFGRYVTESFTYTDEDGNEQTGICWKQNPDYDATQKYVPRAERKEWSAIGMLGVLSVIDNGRCIAGKYCSVANDGTAVPSETGYRVIKRVSENVVEVVFR